MSKYSSQELITYLAKRLAWRADREADLLNDNTRRREALVSFLSKANRERLGDSWEGISESAVGELKRKSELSARLCHVAFFSLMIFVSAGFEGYFGAGFIWLLLTSAVFITLSPALSWLFVVLPANGKTRKMAKILESESEDSRFPGFFVWVTRDPVVRIITPSFLVAVVGLIGAVVAIEHVLHNVLEQAHETHHRKEPLDAILLNALDPGWGRVRLWIWQGRGELALSALLGLAAYLIESVLENLSLTRDGLKGTLQNAKDTAASMSDTKEDLFALKHDLQLLNDDVRATALEGAANRGAADFHALIKRSERLTMDARKRSFEDNLREVDIALTMAEDAVSRRTQHFVESMSVFFRTISSILSGDIGNSDDKVSLYQTNLILTAFEAAIQGQDNLFRSASSNGKHFNIVAPFESLALTVGNLIESVLTRPPHITNISKNRNLRLYTVLPIRPGDFFSRAKWTGDLHTDQGKAQLVASPEPVGARAQSWVTFLAQSRRAAAAGKPVVIRHFVSVDEKLIEEIDEDYQFSLAQHLRQKKAEDGSGERGFDWDSDLDEAQLENGPCWNPLALESDRFLLRERDVRADLDGCFVKRAVGSAAEAVVPWVLSKKGGGWSVQVKACPENSPLDADAVLLRQALSEYHVADVGDGRGGGLRLLKVAKEHWNRNKQEPKPGSPLSMLLKRMGPEWVWVDYLAAAIVVDGKEEWVFAVKSYFHADMGVVNMHLCFRGHDNWTTRIGGELSVVEQLDTLFGRGAKSGEVGHIEDITWTAANDTQG